MNRSLLRIRALLLLPIVFLNGCGGGGGSGGGGAAGTAEGLWSGTTSTARAVSGLVLDNGTYWVLYSMAGNSAVIAGVVQGTGSASNGNFSSSNARDFNFEGIGVNNATVSANYAKMQTFDGTITYSGLAQTVTFNTDYDSDYDQVPSLATVSGTYNGTAVTDGGYDSAVVTVSGTGALNGLSSLGCAFAGTANVHASGNVYDISVTFGGGNCANGTTTVNGVAYLDPSTNTIYSAALNATRTNGFLFVGAK